MNEAAIVCVLQGHGDLLADHQGLAPGQFLVTLPITRQLLLQGAGPGIGHGNVMHMSLNTQNMFVIVIVGRGNDATIVVDLNNMLMLQWLNSDGFAKEGAHLFVVAGQMW